VVRVTHGTDILRRPGHVSIDIFSSSSLNALSIDSARTAVTSGSFFRNTAGE